MNTKRLSKVNIVWSNEFAYAIGLITTDGNLSPDGRHISFTTKDLEQAVTFRKCLKLDSKIGKKARGGSLIKKYYVVQFGDTNFYEFLLSIGLKPAKSKTLGELKIPEQFFFHFLRGCIDGDGNINVASHPESQYPQLRIRLCAYNLEFLTWIHRRIRKLSSIQGGWITKTVKLNVLIFAKGDSIKLMSYLYSDKISSPYLTRKYNICIPFLGE